MRVGLLSNFWECYRQSRQNSCSIRGTPLEIMLKKICGVTQRATTPIIRRNTNHLSKIRCPNKINKGTLPYECIIASKRIKNYMLFNSNYWDNYICNKYINKAQICKRLSNSKYDSNININSNYN